MERQRRLRRPRADWGSGPTGPKGATGAKGPTGAGTTGAKGATGPTGVANTYENGADFSVPPTPGTSQGTIGTVNCNSGDEVTGGGFEGEVASGGGHVDLIGSSYSGSGGWSVLAYNPTGTTFEEGVYVECIHP